MIYLTVNEFADMARVHIMSVYRMIKNKKIPTVDVGGRKRIPLEVVEKQWEDEINRRLGE